MKRIRTTIAGAMLIGATMAVASCSGRPDGEGDDHATQNEQIDTDTDNSMPQDTAMTDTDTTATM